MVEYVVFGVFALLGIVLLVIERRINRKPKSEQSAREQRFMKTDQAVGQGLNTYYTQVSPVLGIVLGAGAVILGVVWLATNEVKAGATLAGIGLALIAFFLVYLRMRNGR